MVCRISNCTWCPWFSQKSSLDDTRAPLFWNVTNGHRLQQTQSNPVLPLWEVNLKACTAVILNQIIWPDKDSNPGLTSNLLYSTTKPQWEAHCQLKTTEIEISATSVWCISCERVMLANRSLYFLVWEQGCKHDTWPSCSFKFAFMHWDLLILTFDHLRHCCLGLTFSLSLKCMWLVYIVPVGILMHLLHIWW